MLMTFAMATSAFLSQLSFWLLVVGVVLLLMRGMGPPGTKSLDKKKYYEVSWYRTKATSLFPNGIP
jgi:hypothetical protein